MTAPGWDALTAALAAHRAQRVDTSGRRAAVALVLRDEGKHGRPELLFIRRAEHEKDPWSGHMGFPGAAPSAAMRASPRPPSARRSRRRFNDVLLRGGPRRCAP